MYLSTGQRHSVSGLHIAQVVTTIDAEDIQAAWCRDFQSDLTIIYSHRADSTSTFGIFIAACCYYCVCVTFATS